MSYHRKSMVFINVSLFTMNLIHFWGQKVFFNIHLILLDRAGQFMSGQHTLLSSHQLGFKSLQKRKSPPLHQHSLTQLTRMMDDKLTHSSFTCNSSSAFKKYLRNEPGQKICPKWYNCYTNWDKMVLLLHNLGQLCNTCTMLTKFVCHFSCWEAVNQNAKYTAVFIFWMSHPILRCL